MINMSVVLNVKDVKRSMEFYRALGFEVNELEEAGVRYAEAMLDGARIELFPKESPWTTAEMREWLRGPLGNGVVIDFETNDLEEMYDAARGAGATIESPLGEQPWGQRAFMFDDPDGYVFLVGEPSRGIASRKAKQGATHATRAAPAGGRSTGAPRTGAGRS